MCNRKEANFGFQEFAVWFQFIPNKKGSTNSMTEIIFVLFNFCKFDKSYLFIQLGYQEMFNSLFTKDMILAAV
ncbi:unnamed protein product [Malus baccata var. baccata]